MTYPRSHLVDTENGGYYHVFSRCVRRARLCGVDESTGQNFDHRKDWIENRILQLSEIFSVAVYSYAVMSNHYHIVLKVDPQYIKNWSDQKVVERWLMLCPKKLKGRICEEANRNELNAVLGRPERLRVLRERLGSLSWFMKFLNEPLARLANKEDGCTGHFWEGRFNSKALIDECSVLAGMVYVDLNPIRAGICNQLHTSQYTSVKHRLESQLHNGNEPLKPVATGTDSTETLPMSLEVYLDLVRWTSESQGSNRCPVSTPKNIKTLSSLSIDQEQWVHLYLSNRNPWQRAIGLTHRLKIYAKSLGQNWIKQYTTSSSA